MRDKKGCKIFKDFWLEHLEERWFHLPGESRCVRVLGEVGKSKFGFGHQV